jgi:hypothetical protein
LREKLKFLFFWRYNNRLNFDAGSSLHFVFSQATPGLFQPIRDSLSLGPAGCCWPGGVLGPSRGFGSAKSLEQRPVGTGWEEQPRTSHSVWLGIVHSPLPSYRQLATNAIHILIHIHIHNNVNQSTTAVTTSTIKIIK